MKKNTHHDLDCWPTYFYMVKTGEKTFEVRNNDRNFQSGDTVTLHCMDEDAPRSESNIRTGEQLTFSIGAVLLGGVFGIDPRFCVFSLIPESKPFSVKKFKTEEDWTLEIHADNVRIASGYPTGNPQSHAGSGAIMELVALANEAIAQGLNK